MLTNAHYQPIMLYTPEHFILAYAYNDQNPKLNGYKAYEQDENAMNSSTEIAMNCTPINNSNCIKHFEKQCPVCNQLFKNLKKHLLSHVAKTENISTSDQCDMFHSDAQFNNNRLKHRNHKPFSCDICKKRFTQAGNLKTHLRIHTGDRPFACNLCDKRFTQSINLINHLRTHSKERPFKCSICTKSFTQSGNLKTHIRTHNTDTRLNCHLCNKSYTQYVNLKKHFLNSHPETSDFVQ